MNTQFRGPIVCFSHLRWGFVFQRPQHLLSRLASQRAVYYIEEPAFVSGATPRLVEDIVQANVTVVRPELPPMGEDDCEQAQAQLLRSFLARKRIADPVLWYYTPMALGWSDSIRHSACVYDCMDELSLFAFAPAKLQERERALFAKAGVVFTGGRSLYYKKRKHHANVRCFPSAVDAKHFEPRAHAEPADMRPIGRPRFGFYGVVDERFDCEYVAGIARQRPDWQFIIVGPVAKIDPGILPRSENIHYIGQRSYDELPAYLHHWDIAILPFARNGATRFISPTKTLEYLAARKPVISTPIADVIDPYGQNGLVGIAATPHEFVALGDDALRDAPAQRWLNAVSRTVEEHSWDGTAAAMSAELDRLSLAKVLA